MGDMIVIVKEDSEWVTMTVIVKEELCEWVI